MYCNIVIVGNVGYAPEYRITPNGKPVCNFSVAVNRKHGDNTETTWFRVTTWEKLADICNQYVTKGMLVLVDGDRIAANSFLKSNGDHAASLEVTARNVRFIGGNRTQGEQMTDDMDNVPF